MSRAKLVRQAVRPAMKAKALITGPTGAGKTWTALSMMRKLVGPDGTILLIDTERESALTYADQFVFDHLPFAPPFDPTELCETLIDIDGDYDGIIVDSLSHFWTGTGGTLEIADGKFTGWKGARPIQNTLQDVLIGVRCHAFYCARSKMEYAQQQGGDGKYEVTRLGMAPVQDSTLMYDMNVSVDLDMEHRMTVTKSRTTAVPVGRMYPAGHQNKCAEDYGEWLEGGVPPAAHEDIMAIIAWLNNVLDGEERLRLKKQFVAEVGVPDTLTEYRVAEAHAWLEANVGPQEAQSQPQAAADTAEKPDEAATEPDNAAESEPEPEAPQGPEAEKAEELKAWIGSMKAGEVRTEAKAAGINSEGPHKEVRNRLFAHSMNVWRKGVQAAFDTDSPDDDVSRETFDEEADPIAAEFAGS